MWQCVRQTTTHRIWMDCVIRWSFVAPHQFRQFQFGCPFIVSHIQSECTLFVAIIIIVVAMIAIENEFQFNLNLPSTILPHVRRWPWWRRAIHTEHRQTDTSECGYPLCSRTNRVGGWKRGKSEKGSSEWKKPRRNRHTGGMIGEKRGSARESETETKSDANLL